MRIEQSVALVTGANRGLGKAFAEALLANGASKVYAVARDPATITDSRLTPIRLDVTSKDDIAVAVRACPDLTLLVNNAGILDMSPLMAENAEQALRRELEVNVFGMMNVSRAFAPILKANGGGAIINMLSVVSWFISPMNSTYGVSKHAALGVSEALRVELAGQGTQVVGVHAGFIDTDMAAGVSMPKSSPADVAAKALQGLRDGVAHVRADARAEDVWAATRQNPEIMAKQMIARLAETKA